MFSPKILIWKKIPLCPKNHRLMTKDSHELVQNPPLTHFFTAKVDPKWIMRQIRDDFIDWRCFWPRLNSRASNPWDQKQIIDFWWDICGRGVDYCVMTMTLWSVDDEFIVHYTHNFCCCHSTMHCCVSMTPYLDTAVKTKNILVLRCS